MPESSYSEKEGVVLVLVLECQRALRATKRSRRSRPPRRTDWIGIGLLGKKEKKESTLAGCDIMYICTRMGRLSCMTSLKKRIASCVGPAHFDSSVASWQWQGWCVPIQHEHTGKDARADSKKNERLIECISTLPTTLLSQQIRRCKHLLLGGNFENRTH